jgi:hypothetical protein
MPHTPNVLLRVCAQEADRRGCAQAAIVPRAVARADPPHCGDGQARSTENSGSSHRKTGWTTSSLRLDRVGAGYPSRENLKPARRCWCPGRTRTSTMFPPPDFESGVVYCNYMIRWTNFTVILCMCKKLCKFWLFWMPSTSPSAGGWPRSSHER